MQQSYAAAAQGDMAVSGRKRAPRPTFVVSSMGYNDDLLYWRRILVELGLLIGEFSVLSSSNSDEVLGDAGVKIVRSRSFRIVYGRREGSYDRILQIPSPSVLIKLLRYRPSVVVLSEFTPSTLLGWVYSMVFRSTPVLHLCESDPTNDSRRPLGQLKTLLRRVVLRRSSHVLTNNASGRRHLETLGVESSKISATPYISSVLPHQAGGRQQGDQSPRGALKVLVTAQVVARKGPEQLIESVRTMTSSLQETIDIAWIGGGELLAGLQTEGSCPRCVRFVGPQPYDQMAQWHGWADVMLIPTLHDYRALVGFEALASGLPILHSIYDGACDEVTVEKANGYRYDPHDPEQLGRLLEELATDRTRLAKMGECSLARAAEFTPERCARNLAAAIETAACSSQSAAEPRLGP